MLTLALFLSYAVGRSDQKMRDFILKTIEDLGGATITKQLLLWEEAKRRGQPYSGAATATELDG